MANNCVFSNGIMMIRFRQMQKRLKMYSYLYVLPTGVQPGLINNHISDIRGKDMQEDYRPFIFLKLKSNMVFLIQITCFEIIHIKVAALNLVHL